MISIHLFYEFEEHAHFPKLPKDYFRAAKIQKTEAKVRSKHFEHLEKSLHDEMDPCFLI